MHIADSLPLLNSVPYLGGVSSTPLQGIQNVKGRIFQIGIRNTPWIFAKQFFKPAPADRNHYNLIFDCNNAIFFTYRLSIVSSVLPMVYVDWRCKDPMRKTSKVPKYFIFLWKIPFIFHVSYPSQMYFPSLPGCFKLFLV